jgi:hypothetical protein
MHMGQKQMGVKRSGRRHQSAAKHPDTGSGIEDEQGAVVQAHFDTRGIPPIVRSLWAR